MQYCQKPSPCQEYSRCRMGSVPPMGQLLRVTPWYPCDRGSATVDFPGVFRLWSHREEVTERADPYLYEMWSGTGPRSERGAQHSRKGITRYPGAQGNLRRAGKRFWTDCLYAETQTGYGQAGWLKEEPPAFDAGECQFLQYWNAKDIIQRKERLSYEYRTTRYTDNRHQGDSRWKRPGSSSL